MGYAILGRPSSAVSSATRAAGQGVPKVRTARPKGRKESVDCKGCGAGTTNDDGLCNGCKELEAADGGGADGATRTDETDLLAERSLDIITRATIEAMGESGGPWTRSWAAQIARIVQDENGPIFDAKAVLFIEEEIVNNAIREVLAKQSTPPPHTHTHTPPLIKFESSETAT